jgi:hypothetical protein
VTVAVRLAEILAEAATFLAGAEVAEGPVATVWSLSGRPFAALSGGTAEFCLDALLAPAARRTPDTTGSPRGKEWVAFSPAILDRYAEDRLRAWFAAAYRRAAG